MPIHIAAEHRADAADHLVIDHNRERLRRLFRGCAPEPRLARLARVRVEEPVAHTHTDASAVGVMDESVQVLEPPWAKATGTTLERPHETDDSANAVVTSRAHRAPRRSAPAIGVLGGVGRAGEVES